MTLANHNPAHTQGFSFLEFASPEKGQLEQLFSLLGFTQVAQHKTRAITLWQQNNIRFFINHDPKSHAVQFSKERGPCTSAMGFDVKNASQAFDHTLSKNAKAYRGEKLLSTQIPVIYGIGGSLLYLVDDHVNAQIEAEFDYTTQRVPSGVGLGYLDHVTHNVARGNMDTWAGFYERLFNFSQIRYFDIKGRVTGLYSRAMGSPCGNIKIPINESSDDHSQIEEFLQRYKGEGIQHIALHTDDIYGAVENLRSNGMKFMDTPDTYYNLIHKRIPGHAEPMALLQKHRVLIDGSTDEQIGILLQIFTDTVIGPIFFEVIQRKGNQGFGEGNFQALFESIELDQIQRGVIKDVQQMA